MSVDSWGPSRYKLMLNHPVKTALWIPDVSLPMLEGIVRGVDHSGFEPCVSSMAESLGTRGSRPKSPGWMPTENGRTWPISATRYPSFSWLHFGKTQLYTLTVDTVFFLPKRSLILFLPQAKSTEVWTVLLIT